VVFLFGDGNSFAAHRVSVRGIFLKKMFNKNRFRVYLNHHPNMEKTMHKTSSRLPEKRTGFTLIELLVVIAIIAILAAILFPVFARARENARRSSCQSNLKQLGLGVMQYVQDYDEKYPYALMGDNGTPSPAGTGFGTTYWIWYQTLQPYTRSFQVAVCPSGNGAYSQTPYDGHYGANRLMMPDGRPTAPPPIAAASIESVATTYLLMDAGPYMVTPSDATGPGGSFWYTPGACGPGGDTTTANAFAAWEKSDCQTGRHLEGNNIAFADGHVKWLKNTKVVEEAKKTGNGAWNPANP
jgi:prepilin-type N-terminal cleavage/methylation domain-containing protein/prepilin-type processing-associated H-X9-DG protein